MKKVFIDGSAGTTGLQIYDRLARRTDIELVILSGEQRKDPAARKEALNNSDVSFLCLPDDAAREAAAMTENENAVIIDTSTAHRTAEGWIYGFPELSGQKEKIVGAKRIANPGCHASGFISLIAPLTEKGVLAPDTELSCFSITGYSGGGKKMIAQYEAETPDRLLSAPRVYGLPQTHKHLPEMVKLCGLASAPVFLPTVCPFYSGMEVNVPLFRKDIDEIKEVYRQYYAGSVIKFKDGADEEGFLSAAALSDTDSMQITVTGNSDRMVLTSRFDNLGKGASGSAVQNMNLVLGVSETEGLVLV